MWPFRRRKPIDFGDWLTLFPEQPSFEIEFKIFPSDPGYGLAAFGPHAFDGQVGKEIPVGGARGILVAATVADDGAHALLRLRMSDEAAEEWCQPRIRKGDFSIREEDWA